MIAVRLLCRDEASFKPSRSELDHLSIHFHSDTLWSALVNIFSRAYPQPDTDAFIQATRAGQIALSSVFPCLERPDGNIVYLFPKPIGLGAAQPDQVKTWKSIRWVSQGVIRHGKPDLDLCLGKDTLLSTEEIPAGMEAPYLALRKPRFIRFRDLPKVQRHNQDREGNLYYQSQLQVRHDRVGREIWKPHFYFLVELGTDLSEGLRAKVMAAIRLLPDTGLGGERSTGLGLFEGVVESTWENFAEDALNVVNAESDGSAMEPVDQVRMTLSAVSLRDQAEYNALLAYDSLVRGGGAIRRSEDPGWHRRRIRMVSEGSLFLGELKGCVKDISPDKRPVPFPIYRYGGCLSLPLHSDLVSPSPIIADKYTQPRTGTQAESPAHTGTQTESPIHTETHPQIDTHLPHSHQRTL